MLFRSILLPTLLIPMIGASVALLLLKLVPGEEPSVRARGAAATGLAFLSGFVAMSGWPRFPPVEAIQRLFFVVVAALVVGWVVRSILSGWIVRAVLTAATLVLLLETPLKHTWSGFEGALWLGGLFGAGMGMHASWAASLGNEGDSPDWVAAGVRIGLLSGIAALLGLSASARLAQLAGALASGVGVIEVGSRVLNLRPWHRQAALVLSTVTLGLLLCGYFYAELRPWPAALALLSCVLLGAPIGNRRLVRPLTLLPLTIAIGLAAWTMLNRPQDPYGDYYGTLRPAQVEPLRTTDDALDPAGRTGSQHPVVSRR